jgi:hypothetical protein
VSVIQVDLYGRMINVGYVSDQAALPLLLNSLDEALPEDKLPAGLGQYLQ